MQRLILAGLFGLVVLGWTAAAAEPAPEWSAAWTKYKSAGDPVSGTVISADASSVKVQVPKMIPGKPGKKGPGAPTLGHEDLTINFAPEGLVRWVKQPKKDDGTGKMVPITGKDLDAAKKPTGAKGYAAEKTDLLAGYLVDIHLVRLADLKADKVTPADLVIKQIVITGEGTPPKADRKK